MQYKYLQSIEMYLYGLFQAGMMVPYSTICGVFIVAFKKTYRKY